MGFFDSLLKKRQLGNKQYYLWELKVTDSEYEELKRLLMDQSKKNYRNMSNRFITVCRECALFVAECWRREYDGDGGNAHSWDKIFNALALSKGNGKVETELKKAACSGAENFKPCGVKFEVYKSSRGIEYLDSICSEG